MLNIQDFAVTITGGVLLFIVALNMIFTMPVQGGSSATSKQEPFIVPIATPILSGPGLLAVIMLKSKLEDNNLVITLAILLAWVGVVGVLAAAPYLQRFLGKRGLVALEQVMGLILSLIAIEMIVKGATLLMRTLE